MTYRAALLAMAVASILLALVINAEAAEPICGTTLITSTRTGQHARLVSCELSGTDGDGVAFAVPLAVDSDGAEEIDITPHLAGRVPPISYDATCKNTLGYVSLKADPAGRCLPPPWPELRP